MLLFLIPFLDAFLVGIFLYFLLKFVEGKIFQKLQSADFQNDVEPLLDKRLDDLIANLKIEIPMAAMLLSGPFVDKLKGQARREILKWFLMSKKRLNVLVKCDTMSA